MPDNILPITRKDIFTVGWQDADANGKLSMCAITQFLQESAWKHAQQYGFGYDFIKQQEAIWVMGKLEVQMTFYPQWEDKIIIETWHRPYEGVIAKRDFIIYDSDYKVIGTASSDWFVIGTENRRPKRLQFLDQFSETALPTKAMDEDHLIIDPHKDFTLCFEHKVMFSELDFHGHVNTSRYFEWVINACDPEILYKRKIIRFGIRFQSECNLNEIIQISGELENNEAGYKGIRLHDGKVVFAATLRFEP